MAKKKLKKVQWQWERLSRPQWGELSPLEREEPTFGDRNSRFNNETNEHIFAPFHEKKLLSNFAHVIFVFAKV